MSFSEPFFEVAAQLIPVLFLAMVVEERLQPEEAEGPRERVVRSWVVALLVIGELISLAVIAGGIGPSKGAGSTVASAMSLAGFLIALPVLTRELKSERSRWERLGHATAGVFVIVAIVGTSVAMQFS